MRSEGTRVRDAVRDVVSGFAPEEMPIVDGLGRLDDAAAVRRLRKGPRREPLGFGLGELIVLATPVVWLVLNQYAEHLAEIAADRTGSGLKRLMDKMLGRKGEPAKLPPLTSAQLREVRRRVIAASAQRNMPEDRAEELADAVVARLAIDALEPPDPDDDDPAGAAPAVRG